MMLPRYESKKDPTLKSLIISNLIVMVIAVLQNWSFFALAMVYILQSLSMGFFNLLRAFEHFKHLQRKTPESRFKFLFFSLIFFLVYAQMHFSAIFFMTLNSNESYTNSCISGALFFANHLYSYLYHRKRELKPMKFRTFLVLTVARPAIFFVPLFFGFLLIGFGFGIPIMVLITAKTILDAFSHILEHRLRRAPGDII